MSDIPRAWPGVTVPADYYDGEDFAAMTPAESSLPQDLRLARPTFSACRHRPRLTAVGFGLMCGVFVLVALRDERLVFPRLIVMAALLTVAGIQRRRDVVIADAGTSLLVHRRSASTEPAASTEVTGDEIRRVRPLSSNRFVRYFRPDVWQVGPERIIVDSALLTSLLQRLEEVHPS